MGDHQKAMQEIETELKSGSYPSVLKLLEKLKKKSKLGPEEWIFISETYLDLGELDRSLKILGGEVPSSEY